MILHTRWMCRFRYLFLSLTVMLTAACSTMTGTGDLQDTVGVQKSPAISHPSGEPVTMSAANLLLLLEPGSDNNPFGDDLQDGEFGVPGASCQPEPEPAVNLEELKCLFYTEYSETLGLELEGTEDPHLIMAIEEWLGTPYRLGGCSKNGIDCSCLVKTIYETVYGLSLPRTSGEINREIVPVEVDELKTGDILCFRTRGRRISHIGIYLRDNKFVHASRSYGVTIGDLTSQYFQKRFVTAGRLKDVPAIQVSLEDSSRHE